MTGKVYLVGAGPGDPELLTLKALRILRQADVVLHDSLVAAPILSLAPPGAQILNVGKRCGQRSVSQQEINARLIACARQGNVVVRLKAGDPVIFGRVGEEIDALRDAEVDFEIVPGVTAASAAAAEAGISLTHRRLASTVVFLSGHDAAGKVGSKWPNVSLGDSRLAEATVVVYMPGPDYGRLRDRLLAAGIRGETPCLLVSAASTASNLNHLTIVDKLADLAGTPTPSILLVGEVARLARETGIAARPWESGQWRPLCPEDLVEPFRLYSEAADWRP